MVGGVLRVQYQAWEEGEGEEGEEEEERESGGTFWVPSSIPFATRQEAEQYLMEAIEESNGNKGHDVEGMGDTGGDGADLANRAVFHEVPRRLPSKRPCK